MSFNSWFRDMPEYGAAVTPADTGHLEQPATLFIGGSGNLKVLTVGGSTVTFTGVLSGSVLPVLVVRVFSTGTTATNIAAMW